MILRWALEPIGMQVRRRAERKTKIALRTAIWDAPVMKRGVHASGFRWLLASCIGVHAACAAPQVMDFTPRAGPGGTVLTLVGSGFGTDAGAVSATVGGVPAGIVSVADGEVRMNAPSASGQVEVTVNGESSLSLLPFTATRTANGTFVPPAGMNAAGYFTGSVRAPVAGLSFSVQVSQSQVDTVWAWRGENDGMFGALIFPGAAAVQINAESTALLMLALSPLMPKGDPAALQGMVTRVTGTPELTAVVSLISQAAAGGYNWAEDGRFSQAYEALLLRAVAPPPPQGNGNGARAFVHPGEGRVRALRPSRGIAPLRLKYDIGNAPDGNLQLRVSPSQDDPTRLHQNVEIWRVSPSWFTDGFAHIDRLNFSDRPTLLGNVPRDMGYVSAKLASGNLDLGELISKAVSGFLFGDVFKPEGDAKFTLPRLQAGVYMVNAYSGNVWYGATRVDPEASQAVLLGQLDRNGQWTDALVTNIVLGAMDVVGILLPDFKFIGSSELGKMMKSSATKATKMLITYVGANGEIDLWGAGQISRAVFNGIFKATVGILTGEAADGEWSGPLQTLVGGGAKLLKVALSATSKVSSALQVVERGAAMIAPTHFAVERAVVTVGDPFAPAITAFFPPSGRAGDELILTGEFLPSSSAGFEVHFITFAATGNPPPINARLKATILNAVSGTWTIRAPNADQWQSTFGNGDHWVYLGIRNTVTGAEAVTHANTAPNQQWRYHAPPQITGVTPNPARSGSIVTITATGLHPRHHRSLDLELDGATYVSSLTLTDAEVHVRLPSGLTNGPHTLRFIHRNGAFQIAGASNTLTFTVSDPLPPVVLDARRRLRVNSVSMANTPDGNLTLHEALALAVGSLGRSITIRPEGQSEGNFESDRVDFPGGQAGSYGEGSDIRDEIVIEQGVGSLAVSLVAPLPRPGNGDVVQLSGVVFDGAGTPPGTVGWDLRGVDGHRLDGPVEFRNFSGGGILLGNGSEMNAVWNASVTNCGGDGVVLAGDASGNFLRSLIVRGSPGVGVRLSGAGVRRNELVSAGSIPLFGDPDLMRVTGSGSHGLLIEAGASGNVVDIWEARNNGGDGIRLAGNGTSANYIGGASFPGYRDAAGNTGNGLTITGGANGTVVQNVAAGGNGGDGFLVEGPGTARNDLRSIATGFDYAAKLQPGFVRRNAGHSVRIVNSADNAIGTNMRGSFVNSPPCALGGSSGGATVLITGAGSHGTTLDGCTFGFMEPWAAPQDTPPNLLLAPAATHSLHLTDGAHDNVIGHTVVDAATDFLASPNGAALRIEGAGTNSNRVIGCSFGISRGDIALDDQQVRIGIHIVNGPRGNRIGEGGNRVQTGALRPLQPYNQFGYIVEAAIRLEGVSASMDAQGNPVDANIVLNNRMGLNVFGGGGLPPQHPEVGIHLKNSVTGQWIGSLNRALGNQISLYGYAGIWIENGIVTTYADRNRIAGNWTNTAYGTSATSANTDPFLGPVTSHALLITGGAGQVVGEDFVSYNQFNGARVTAYIEGGTGHWLRGNWFDSGVRGGVFIHDGANHRVGGAGGPAHVQITRSGAAGDDNTAAVVLAGGGGHRVQNTLIGDRGTVDTIWGSRGHGVLVHESQGNTIGGTARAEGNVIVRSTLDGIHLRGAGSHHNRIGNNRLGTGSLASVNPGNLGAGVNLTGGAHDNLIGGDQIPFGAPGGMMTLPAPNVIQGNTGDGVRVFGNATTGNSVLGNSIAGNGGLGIRHVSGGNHLQPVPQSVHIEKGRVFGSVDPATTPPGSRIEAFMNVLAPGPEGDIYLGHGIVRADGTFSFNANILAAGAIITATATHITNGDTSEFTVGTTLPPEFGFTLAVPQGESTLTKSWPVGAPFSAVVLTAKCDSATVEVQRLKVRALGTGGFAGSIAGVSLFEDVDRNGQHSAPDRELAPMTPFSAGEVELVLSDAFVSEAEERRWVIRLHPVAGVPPAGTVRLEVADANAVGEYYWQPLGATGVAAVFPLQSALFEPGSGGDPRAAWRASHGLPADGSGNGGDFADPDRDGYVNLLEYALGSSPVDAGETARPAITRAGAPDRITLTYQKLRADVRYAVEAAGSLAGPWSTAGVDQGGSGPTVTASVPVGGERTFVRLRVE